MEYSHLGFEGHSGEGSMEQHSWRWAWTDTIPKGQAMDSVEISSSKGRFETQTHREENHKKTEANME